MVLDRLSGPGWKKGGHDLDSLVTSIAQALEEYGLDLEIITISGLSGQCPDYRFRLTPEEVRSEPVQTEAKADS